MRRRANETRKFVRISYSAPFPLGNYDDFSYRRRRRSPQYANRNNEKTRVINKISRGRRPTYGICIKPREKVENHGKALFHSPDPGT